jgi:hypothetical protein
LLSSVDVVAKEQIIGLGRKAAIFKKTQQVVVLSVDIATDFDGCLKLKQHGLANQDIATPKAEHLDFGLRHVHLLSGTGAPDTAKIKQEESCEAYRFDGDSLQSKYIKRMFVGLTNKMGDFVM